LIVTHALSNHPNDKQEALPTLEAIPAEIGKPEATAMDNGYFSAANITACQERGIEAYIATGREPHHQDWCSFFADLSEPPGEAASPKEKMAYKLLTEIGQAIYRLRKCTIEPVIGIIKEILGFRQFSLRGLWAAAGEWCLVCLAFNLKRMHTLYLNQGLIWRARNRPESGGLPLKHALLRWFCRHQRPFLPRGALCVENFILSPTGC